jgi:NAD(P)H-hydrate epimerase
MFILNSQQLREADIFTIQQVPVSSIQLMERAAIRCSSAFLRDFVTCNSLTVVCGHGNNGGDGLAIARLLSRFIRVSVIILDELPLSPDAQVNLLRLQKETSVPVYSLGKDLALPPDIYPDIWMDALLGYGLNRPPSELYSSVIHKMNASGIPIVSVDIPSGLPCDTPPQQSSAIVRALVTYSFQYPKLNFFFADYAEYTGKVRILNIGLLPHFTPSTPVRYSASDPSEMKALLHSRAKFSHKGNYGHALIIAGSAGFGGAANLCIKSAIVSGCGLCTAHIPSKLQNTVHTSVPEAMVLADSDSDSCGDLLFVKKTFTAIGAGPGLGISQRTKGMLKLLIQEQPCPLVLDADALNILSEQKTWLSYLPTETILTPHPGEFDRLTRKHQTSRERWESLSDFSIRYKVWVVLKGAYTCISGPSGHMYFNTTGNPGMATGGSGDVLTGLLTGLLASGYSAADACRLGVYLHGLAGDLAASVLGEDSLKATDIISYIGAAFQQLHK